MKMPLPGLVKPDAEKLVSSVFRKVISVDWDTADGFPGDMTEASATPSRAASTANSIPAVAWPESSTCG
jgi:hypothetical protein